jgi:hypothetical protein
MDNPYDGICGFKGDRRAMGKYHNPNISELCSNKIDPRVQNIDKINFKIKKILDCLHQN